MSCTPCRRRLSTTARSSAAFAHRACLMAAAGLWNKMAEAGSKPTDDEIKRALARNACRCTGYASILRSVQSAVHEFETGQPLPPIDIETVEPLNVIGHSYPRPDAVEKVTGSARFTDDYVFPGCSMEPHCAPDTRMPGSCPSTPARQQPCPAYTPF